MRSIISVRVIVGRFVFSVGVVVTDGVVISDCIDPPVRDLKSSGIAVCHPTDHLMNPGGHRKCCLFIAYNKVTIFMLRK